MGDLTQFEPKVRVYIANPDSESRSVFGRGVAQLCIGVRDLGSLNAAAKSIGMAYSKAWRIVKDTEAALGVQLLYRDGAHGSTLTEEGAVLLDTYLELNKRMRQEAKATYLELLSAEVAGEGEGDADKDESAGSTDDGGHAGATNAAAAGNDGQESDGQDEAPSAERRNAATAAAEDSRSE